LSSVSNLTQERFHTAVVPSHQGWREGTVVSTERGVHKSSTYNLENFPKYISNIRGILNNNDQFNQANL